MGEHDHQTEVALYGACITCKKADRAASLRAATPTGPASFGLPVSCHDCGRPVHLVNQTGQTGTRLVAIVACETCRAEWEVTIYLRRAPKVPARA